MRRFLLFVFLAPIAFAAMAAKGGAQPTIDSEIANRVAMIEAAPDTDARIESAAHLAEYIASRGPVEISNIDPPVIDDMAALLNDSDDWVRFYVAASLGFLGPSARRAIPALERALARGEPPREVLPGQARIFAGINSAHAICAAFEKIDLSRVPGNCRGYR